MSLTFTGTPYEYFRSAMGPGLINLYCNLVGLAFVNKTAFVIRLVQSLGEHVWKLKQEMRIGLL